ncbi:MAG: hypothetical protein LBG43_08735 [Treponema sp.]|jgi:uncharacterized Zn finger protein|nr:hypothetical protein [Treponema sp.]
MINGKIEIDCPDCGGTMECRISDSGDPWNESPVYTAKCDECGLQVKFHIQADEPEASKEEG